MQIRQNGRLYRLAYWGRKDEARPTGQVNGCDVIWLAFFKGLGCIVVSLGVAIVVCFCCVAIAAIGYGLWCLVPLFITWLTHSSWHVPHLKPQPIDWMMGGAVILIILAAALSHFLDTEMGHLFRAWLKAKKGRYCPLWEVV